MLLGAVLGIWGIIGYKMISVIRPEPFEIQLTQSLVDFIPKTGIENDTFSIEHVSRDPFLGTIVNKIVPDFKNSQKAMPIEWPLVTYGGMVKKKNTDAQVFVVNINGGQYLLKKGQQVNDITLVKGNSKEVVVRFKNTRQTIPLQK